MHRAAYVKVQLSLTYIENEADTHIIIVKIKCKKADILHSTMKIIKTTLTLNLT